MDVILWGWEIRNYGLQYYLYIWILEITGLVAIFYLDFLCCLRTGKSMIFFMTPITIKDGVV